MKTLPPIHADPDRLSRITVCTRPFRAAGPRIEAERVIDKLVIHNYGHGGSGWSLSWGSANIAVGKALEAGTASKNLAVLGCGALGLTTAVTAQRAGFRVTIYARERPPFVRSSWATGSWTPDARIALASAVTPKFAAQWEAMARASYAIYQSFLATPGTPVEFTDRYYLNEDGPPTSEKYVPFPQQHDFARLQHRLADQVLDWHSLPAGSHPFGLFNAARSSQLAFNITGYSNQLLADFQTSGGSIETREFHTPADLSTLPQPVIINCTGYGARQLFSDDSIIPIRGQIAWLLPQQDANYGIFYKDLTVLARRDGIVIQTNPLGDDTGWNDASEQPDRPAAEAAVRQLQALYDRLDPKGPPISG